MSEYEIRKPIQKRSIEKKGKIIESGFELICEKGLCVDSSELNKMPSQTIKKILSSYQQNREKVLRLVDEGYKKY